ncbi:MAG TPA: hypothetical protein VHX64_12110 [Caulobacteraceae bacterium]|nr:hypothetical protein [Caulobacteraceae bacterium]
MTSESTPDQGLRSSLEARLRGLQVFVPWRGKTLFSILPSSWGLEVRQGFPPKDLSTGLVVLPFPFSAELSFMRQAFSELAAAWSEDLSTAAAEGRVRIVLDASAEGFEHTRPKTRCIHQGLAELGVPLHRAVIITQERNYQADYAHWLAERDFDEGVRVLNYDYWIKLYHSLFEDNGERTYLRRAKHFRRRLPERSRRFVSLNMTVRPSKLLFLLSLVRDGLWDRGHVSFGGLYRKASQFHPDDQQRLSTAYFEDKITQPGPLQALGQELAPYLPELELKEQILFGNIERDPETGLAHKSPLSHIGLPQFSDSWFTVVTETEMRARPSRITEKPFTPLAYFQPFIVFGNPGALAQIRELGYATFDGVIDESYDQIEEPALRFRTAYREFRRLCRFTEPEWGKLEKRLRETLDFNARWAMTQLPGIYRDRLDTELLAQIFAD